MRCSARTWTRRARDLVTCSLFCLRLSFSGKAVHRVSLSGGQEALFEGHEHAFRVLGGVPAGQVRYDNLKAAVAQVLGFTRARVENERWTAFRSHCEPVPAGSPGRPPPRASNALSHTSPTRSLAIWFPALRARNPWMASSCRRTTSTKLSGRPCNDHSTSAPSVSTRLPTSSLICYCVETNRAFADPPAGAPDRPTVREAGFPDVLLRRESRRGRGHLPPPRCRQP
jgi:hypothetical protein